MAPLHARTDRMLDSLRQLGWRDGAWHACARLLQAVPGGRCALHRYRFVAQPVTPGSLCRGRGKAIVVAPCLAAQDLPETPAGPVRPRHVLEERYRQGAQCLLARTRDTGTGMAGWLWLLRGACQEDEVRARYVLAPQASWDLDVWVHPAQRGALVFARLWEEANALLRAHGVRWSCSRIAGGNRASLAAHARLGAVTLGSAIFLRCGRWQWMASTLPPYLHLSRHAASFPVFSFDSRTLPATPPPETPCRKPMP